MIISRIMNRFSKGNMKPLYYFGTHTFKGLPFKIKPEDARTIMEQTRNYFYQSIPDLPHQGETIRFVQVFLPFYSANIANVRTSYKGTFNRSTTSYETRYDEKGKAYQHPSTQDESFPIQGVLNPTDYSFEHKDLQVYADFEYPRKAVEEALTEDLKENYLRQLTVDDLKFQGRKKEIITHKMSNQLAIQKFVKKVQELEKKRAEEFQSKYVHRVASRVTIHKVQINKELLEITLKKFYLPAYIFKSKISEDVFKIVSGYSGKCSGLQLYNCTKIGLATMAFGMFIAIITQAQLASYLYIVPLTYAFGHLIGYSSNIYDRNQFHRDQQQKQTDLLKRIQEQQQDMLSLTKLRVIHLTDSEAARLGVDSIKVYTKDEFLEICEDMKQEIITSNKSRQPRETISLLKQIDRMQTEVLKRNKVN